MSAERVTVECECDSCGGTGLYQGACERDGAAVICTTCNGTGKSIKTYRPYTGRKIKEGVERVYLDNAGYVIGSRDYVTKEGKIIRFSESGCTYAEWLKGKDPEPIRDLLCPYQHTNQSLQNEEHHGFELYSEQCDHHLSHDKLICNCPGRDHLEVCWRRYDELMKGAKK